MDIDSYCSCKDIEWHGCYGSGAKYNKYIIPESVKHPAKMSWELLERIFKHLESMNLLTPDSVVIDFMAGTGRTGTMASLRRYRTISVELEPHFIEMIAGYDCDGKNISDFKIEPCLCKSETLHQPHKIQTGLFEVECSGNPKIVPVCRCGEKIHHRKHHILGNRELLEQVTGRKVQWDVIQGDARELSRLMNLTDMVGVVSPPYFSQVAFQDKKFVISIAEDKSQRVRDGRMGGHYATPEAIRRSAEKIMENYSLDPRNIGNLPDAPLAGIVSPPYQNSLVAKNSPSINKEKQWETYRKQGGGLSYEAFCEQQERHSVEYSSNPDNIANLKDGPLVGIMSPPYSEAQQGGGIAIKGYSGPHIHEMGKNQPDKVGQRCGFMKEVHGNDPANIANLPDRPVVGITSLPYGLGSGGLGNDGRETQVQKDKHIHLHYSQGETNIGNEKEESYLQAMFRVYRQAYLCGISPLVVVTKNPTRNGKLRRLDLDTIYLLQLCSYEIFDYHRAVLFETHTQSTLDGDSRDVHKGRISFFKRLSLEKGTTVAQFEDIIFARIPECVRSIPEMRAPDTEG